MRVIITGSEGFIGSHLSKRLGSSQFDVYEWSKDGIFHKGEIVANFQLENPHETKQALCSIKPDLIVHCAGSADVKYSIEKPYDDFICNYVLTHNLLFGIRDANLKDCQFILLSSASVYGNPISLPMKENEPIQPLSPYALHKRAAEEVCIFMSDNYDIKCKIVRIFSVFGPGLRKQIFWDMFQKVRIKNELNMLGSGEESRDYIFIDDLIEALVLIIQSEKNHTVYNVGNGKEITIKEAATVFAQKMGLSDDCVKFSGVRRQGDPINWCADISLMKELGYVQNHSFEEGVQRYVEWLRNEVDQ